MDIIISGSSVTTIQISAPGWSLFVQVKTF